MQSKVYNFNIKFFWKTMESWGKGGKTLKWLKSDTQGVGWAYGNVKIRATTLSLSITWPPSSSLSRFVRSLSPLFPEFSQKQWPKISHLFPPLIPNLSSPRTTPTLQFHSPPPPDYRRGSNLGFRWTPIRVSLNSTLKRNTSWIYFFFWSLNFETRSWIRRER